jgi:hypothetical protein
VEKIRGRTQEYYECHITIVPDTSSWPVEFNERVKKAVERTGWVYSMIENDIILGHGSKHYATQHFNRDFTVPEVVQLLDITADMLQALGFKIIRRKVELVLHDVRSKP